MRRRRLDAAEAFGVAVADELLAVAGDVGQAIGLGELRLEPADEVLDFLGIRQ